ncbi:MAG: PDZ domain-containing protein, partial [Solirubrobacterales bacterium]
IPINMAKAIADQLKGTGKVSRGYLGLYAQDVEADMAGPLGMKEPEGIVVAQVEKGSPAEKAGLKVQDVILEINGEKVKSYDAFRNDVASLKPESKVHLRILRDGKTENLTAVVGERASAVEAKGQAATDSKQAIGLEVQNLTRDLARQFGYEIGDGVIVSAVVPGGPAAEAGIQPGDLIVSVNRKNVTSVAEYSEAVGQSRNSDRVLLLVRRGDASQFVIVKFQ